MYVIPNIVGSQSFVLVLRWFPNVSHTQTKGEWKGNEAQTTPTPRDLSPELYTCLPVTWLHGHSSLWGMQPPYWGGHYALILLPSEEERMDTGDSGNTCALFPGIHGTWPHPMQSVWQSRSLCHPLNPGANLRTAPIPMLETRLVHDYLLPLCLVSHQRLDSQWGG